MTPTLTAVRLHRTRFPSMMMTMQAISQRSQTVTSSANSKRHADVGILIDDFSDLDNNDDDEPDFAYYRDRLIWCDIPIRLVSTKSMDQLISGSGSEYGRSVYLAQPPNSASTATFSIIRTPPKPSVNQSVETVADQPQVAIVANEFEGVGGSEIERVGDEVDTGHVAFKMGQVRIGRPHEKSTGQDSRA